MARAIKQVKGVLKANASYRKKAAFVYTGMDMCNAKGARTILDGLQKSGKYKGKIFSVKAIKGKGDGTPVKLGPLPPPAKKSPSAKRIPKLRLRIPKLRLRIPKARPVVARGLRVIKPVPLRTVPTARRLAPSNKAAPPKKPAIPAKKPVAVPTPPKATKPAPTRRAPQAPRR